MTDNVLLHDDPIHDGESAAKFLNSLLGTRKTRGSLARERYEGIGCPYFLVSNRFPRYRESDLRAYALAKLSVASYTSTSEYSRRAEAA